MRKGFVRDKETAMPDGIKDGDVPEEMGYIHPKTGVFYEIHTRLFSTESSAYGYLNRAFSDVFAHPSRVEVQGQSIFTLEETHHLFYLLCHSFKHFLHGGVGIRQICDMVQMIRIYGRKIDWEMFWQLCEEYHMMCFCINLLDIGERYLGFSYEASGAVRATKKLRPDSEALLIDLLDAGSFGKSSAGRIHSANITLYAIQNAEKAGYKLYGDVEAGAPTQEKPGFTDQTESGKAQRRVRYCTIDNQNLCEIIWGDKHQSYKGNPTQ